MKRPRLLGIGGAHVDRRGTMHADYIYGASIPGHMNEETGGGVFNALRTAVQFQTNCAMLSVRGGDAAGDMVANEMKLRGIDDLSSVFLDRTTASYTALLTSEGDVVAALADMSIYETALPRQISRRKTRDAISASDAILIDANMPEDALVRLVSKCQGKPIFAIAISPAKAVRLKPVLGKLTCLFLNQREARAIIGDQEIDERNLAVKLSNTGLTRFVLTNGARDVCVGDQGAVHFITPPQAAHVVDVTGAGDALAGATIATLLKLTPFPQAVRYGLAAAALTVQTAQSVSDYSEPDKFQHLLAQMKP